MLAEGWCVVPDVLSGSETEYALARLWAAAQEYQRRGRDTFMPAFDPNAVNVRVFELLELDTLFRELIRAPLALKFARALLGSDILISNFTANIALAAGLLAADIGGRRRAH